MDLVRFAPVRFPNSEVFMGLPTLITGEKSGGKGPSRRGDFALVVSAMLAALEIWRQLQGQPAQAADDAWRVRMETTLAKAVTDIEVLKVEINRKK